MVEITIDCRTSRDICKFVVSYVGSMQWTTNTFAF